MREQSSTEAARAFFENVPEAGLDALPDGVSVTLVLHGEGGGTWTVSRRDGETEVHAKAASRPDCHLSCTVADLRALIRGDLDPRRGFLEGRLLVEGDVGLVLRLRRHLQHDGADDAASAPRASSKRRAAR